MIREGYREFEHHRRIRVALRNKIQEIRKTLDKI
jgi:hypothetical protein